MKDVQHPNILGLADFHKDDHYIYIITKFCNGGNLENHIMGYTKKYGTGLPE